MQDFKQSFCKPYGVGAWESTHTHTSFTMGLDVNSHDSHRASPTRAMPISRPWAIFPCLSVLSHRFLEQLYSFEMQDGVLWIVMMIKMGLDPLKDGHRRENGSEWAMKPGFGGSAFGKQVSMGPRIKLSHLVREARPHFQTCSHRVHSNPCACERDR